MLGLKTFCCVFDGLKGSRLVVFARVYLILGSKIFRVKIAFWMISTLNILYNVRGDFFESSECMCCIFD